MEAILVPKRLTLRKMITILLVVCILSVLLLDINGSYTVLSYRWRRFYQRLEYFFFKMFVSIANVHDFSYTILENTTCQTSNGFVHLVVVVCVASGNFDQRQTVRETWGSVVKTNSDIKLVFMLGSATNRTIQEKINFESTKYHDIIQEDFVDSYKNLSLKSVAMLKWTLTYCSSAKYLLKADDDMFVNLDFLIKVLKYRKLNNTVMGVQISGAKPVQNESSKWYTPPKMFSGTEYPPYCSGTSYVISGDSLERLYTVSLRIPFFWLEDVFITGMCRLRAKVDITNHDGFTYDKPEASGCVFRKRITGHRYSETEIRKIWTDITNSSLRCAQ